MQFDTEAVWPLRMLNGSGHEAYLVGGCVRDALMGLAYKDVDIATSADPQAVTGVFEALGSAVLPTGLKHGTVTVRRADRSFEVTTYRIDGAYSDGRHPDDVRFSQNITDDLARRDFTINAMAWSPDAGLVDPFGGRDDARDRVIRAVGEPAKRFAEDALRMMRAVRFSAKLGFEIEPQTAEAIAGNAHGLRNVSLERVSAELVQTVCAEHAERFRLFHELGLLVHFLPELVPMFTPESARQNSPYHVFDIGAHTLLAMTLIPPEAHLRLCMLFHDSGKPFTRSVNRQGYDSFYGHAAVSARMARQALGRLKFSGALIHKVAKLVSLHDALYKPDRVALKRMMGRLGSVPPADWEAVARADALAKNPAKAGEAEAVLRDIHAMLVDVLDSGEAYTLKQLAISGADVQALGASGPAVGKLLSACLAHVIRYPKDNARQTLLRFASERLER